MTTIYSGFIVKFLVKRDDWGLALFRREDQEKLQLKIKGNIMDMKPHVRYEITGQLVANIKYGPSFEVQTFKLMTFTQAKQTIKYLTSKRFLGVTKSDAELIFKTLGHNWLEKIQNDYQILTTIKQLDPKLIPIIQAGIKYDYQKSPIEQKFREQDLSLSIYQKLKELTVDEQEIEALLENQFLTWSYKQSLGTIQELDQIAQKFGLSVDAPERIGFWLEHCVTQLLRQTGDTYTDLTTLTLALSKQLGNLSLELIKNGLLYAKEQKWLYFIKHKIYSRESWTDENTIAEKLAWLKSQKSIVPTCKWTSIIKKIETKVGQLIQVTNFHFDQNQIDCLKKLIKEPILIISGGPGAGKSTLILGLALLYRHLYPQHKINIATPTGRASMRLKSVLPEFNPMTLHRLLEFDENAFHRNSSNPLEASLVIIDEMSMVDNHLFASFLKAGKNLTKLVLVGDNHQLPPVSYGDVFNDLIVSEEFTNLFLTTNHRQNHESGIVKLAKAVQENQLHQINWRELPQVEIIFEETDDNLMTLKLDYSHYYNPKQLDVMAYQIIAPNYKGTRGIDLINHEFQTEFNEALKTSAKIYRPGPNRCFTINDKIICNRNFPEYDLANGEIGIIKELEFQGNDFTHGTADFGGKIVPLDKELFNHLSLSYACSIHKTQGSEYQKVALVLNEYSIPNSFLNKKLIYTAITRAKNELLIIANRETFIKIASHEPTLRSSTIPEKIKNQLNI